jgi:hypothetical protein
VKSTTYPSYHPDKQMTEDDILDDNVYGDDRRRKKYCRFLINYFLV